MTRRAHVRRCCGLLLALAAAPALAGTVTGVVFEDGNGNGVRDGGEPGIAGVKLSNGRSIVRSATPISRPARV